MRTCALVVSVLFAVGCGDPAVTEEEVVEVEEISDGLGTWAKIGTLPSNLYGTSLTGMHYAHGKFWIGSDDLVMEGKPSIYGGWSWRAALNAEYRVVGVGSSNTGVVAGVAYETIRRAPTTGNGWLAVGPELPGTVYDFAKTPSGVVYGDIAGQIVRSRDGGATWDVVYSEPVGDFIGDGCYLEVAPGAPDRLYQLCGGGTTLAYYDISDPAAPLDTRSVSVDSDLIPYRDLGTAIASTASNRRVYVGMDGGLIWVDGDEWDFVWDGDPYQQVSAIWIDPTNPNHLLFGGYHLLSLKLVLMETWNGGQTVTPRPAPSGLGLVDPVVETFTAAGTNGNRLAMTVQTKTGTGYYSATRSVVIMVTP